MNAAAARHWRVVLLLILCVGLSCQGSSGCNAEPRPGAGPTTVPSKDRRAAAIDALTTKLSAGSRDPSTPFHDDTARQWLRIIESGGIDTLEGRAFIWFIYRRGADEHPDVEGLLVTMFAIGFEPDRVRLISDGVVVAEEAVSAGTVAKDVYGDGMETQIVFVYFLRPGTRRSDHPVLDPYPVFVARADTAELSLSVVSRDGTTTDPVALPRLFEAPARPAVVP